MSPAVFIAAHPDDETLAMGVPIAEHLAAGQDVHVLWLTRGEGSGVLAKLNATSGTPNPWWGVMHVPATEGYATLSVADFGQARIDEAHAAVRCLWSGYPGSLTLHEAGLSDGFVTQAAAEVAILALCDAIAPAGDVRLKTHTWWPQLDNHPDHVAAGAAVKALVAADPTRFVSAPRYYILPPYWTDPDLSLVSEVWDNPTDAGVSARVVNAARCYGAWAPDAGRYAIGYHSTYAYFATLLAGPKALFHP